MPLMSNPLTAVQIMSRNGKLLQQGLAVVEHVDTTVSQTNSTQGSLSFATTKLGFLYLKVKCLHNISHI